MNWSMPYKKVLGSVVIATLPSFFALFLPPALVNIIAVLALGTAKLSVGTAGGENLVAVLTGFQRAVRIRQHKAEHHLQT